MRRWLPLVLVSVAVAQDASLLTLQEAEAIAMRNHPRVAAARLAAEASQETAKQFRATLSPVLAANFTGSVAEHGTRIGAGQLNASSLFSRTGAGISISQVIFDFGRVAALTASARSRAGAQAELATAVRAETLLRVREAFFRVLSAETQSRISRATLDTLRLTLRQISALVASNLRSTLDQAFAELNVSEAELALDRAENEARSAMVHLAASMGTREDRSYKLADPELPQPMEGSADALAEQAIRARPDLASLRLNVEAARRFAESERRQSMPAVTAVGAGGFLGARDERLRPHYAALGLNLNIPVLNGGLFDSRRREADIRAEVSGQELRDLEIRVARDVRAAWIDSMNAHRRLALTQKTLEYAAKTLRLAQTRYELGLATIVELNQAQLSRTTAEVGAAAARYDYLLKRSILDYHAGSLR